MKKILQQKEKVLREISKEIPVEEITQPKIKKILKEMFDVLASQDDGVALAAPQIGYSLRLFIISPKIFYKPEEFNLVYINPQIIKKSKDKKKVEEGCLSCRWLYGKTKRSSRATLEAYDENGNKFQVEGTKLIAQIFQHETDHLDGILFIDHAEDVKELDLDDE